MKGKILIIEDEERIVAVLERRLESEGYEVITASNGRLGFNKARQEKPDLIILDLILPEMDGYQICNFLKRDRRYQNIPIVILSARSQEKDMEEAKKAGADAYFTKPFNYEELLGKIEELLLARGEGKK
ncbi:MAG: response regulator [candidate division WOR-3 bacterium]